MKSILLFASCILSFTFSSSAQIGRLVKIRLDTIQTADPVVQGATLKVLINNFQQPGFSSAFSNVYMDSLVFCIYDRFYATRATGASKPSIQIRPGGFLPVATPVSVEEYDAFNYHVWRFSVQNVSNVSLNGEAELMRIAFIGNALQAFPPYLVVLDCTSNLGCAPSTVSEFKFKSTVGGSTYTQLFSGRTPGNAFLPFYEDPGGNSSAFTDTEASGVVYSWYMINSQLTVRPAAASALPVTLLDLYVRSDNNGKTLYWTTANEINFDHYEVEVSKDGSNFIKSESLKAIPGNTQPYTYSTSIKTELTGDIYVRLKMVDKDYRSTYSKIIKVNGSSVRVDAFGVYPNPASSAGSINLHYNNLLGVAQQASLELFDMFGRRLFSRNTLQLYAGSNTISLALPALASGVYRLKINPTKGASTATSIFIHKN